MHRLLPCTLGIWLVIGTSSGRGQDYTLAIDPGPKIARLDGRLAKVWQSVPVGTALDVAAREQVPCAEGRVRAIVESSADLDVVAIERLGGRVELTSGSLARVLISPSRLMALTLVAGVRQVRAPYPANELLESEGVALTAADVYHAQGERGARTRVAVIDLGFLGLSEAIEAGEVMQPKNRWNYAGGPFEGTTVHGTAVAEIIADMVPECELTLVKVDDEVGLAKAAERCAEQGIQIISHSVGWYNTNFYDGTGYVCDVVRRAFDQGLLWVNAVGNSAERHYQGEFVDRDHDGLAEFSAGDEGLAVFVFQGMQLRVALTWDDWQARTTDYDLYLVDAQGHVVARADGHQGNGEEPSEFLSYNGEESDTFALAVRWAAGPPKRFAIHTFNADLEPANRIRERSVVSPADVDTAVAVGAIPQFAYETGPAEGFSSEGPTNANVMKPDITAPDMVRNSSYGYFGGTSAAAPHVAGAAALLVSHNPRLTASELRKALIALAMPMGEANVYGEGRLSLEDHDGPTPNPLELARDPSATGVGELSIEPRLAHDPSGVRYAFSRDGLPFIEPLPTRHLLDVGLAPNHRYAYRVMALDASPWANATEASETPVAGCTWIEAPAQLVLSTRTSHAITVEVRGWFTGLDAELSALRVLRGDPPTPASEWRKARTFVVSGLQPNERVRLSAQSRNLAGVPTPQLAQSEIVTLAVAPPSPLVTTLPTFGPVARLAAGDNTAATSLALGERSRSLWLTPSGNLQAEPYFAVQSLWRDVPLFRLAPGERLLFAVARNEDGILSAPSPTLVIDVRLPGAADGSRPQLAADADPPVSSGPGLVWHHAEADVPLAALPPLQLVTAWRDGAVQLEGIDGATHVRRSRYRLERDDVPIVAWQDGTRFLDHDAPRNSIVRYRLVAQSAQQVTWSDWVTVITPIEAPLGMEVDRAGRASITGHFSNIDEGLSGLQVRFLTRGVECARTEFSRARQITKPEVTFEVVEVRARNRVSAETEWVAVARDIVQQWTNPAKPAAATTPAEPEAAAVPLVAPAATSIAEVAVPGAPSSIVRAAPPVAPPPAPRMLVASDGKRVALDCEQPLVTACLYDVMRGVYLSARGEASVTPVYLLPERWQFVPLRNLDATCRCAIRARVRDASGVLSDFGPALVIDTDQVDKTSSASDDGMTSPIRGLLMPPESDNRRHTNR